MEVGILTGSVTASPNSTVRIYIKANTGEKWFVKDVFVNFGSGDNTNSPTAKLYMYFEEYDVQASEVIREETGVTAPLGRNPFMEKDLKVIIDDAKLSLCIQIRNENNDLNVDQYYGITYIKL